MCALTAVYFCFSKERLVICQLQEGSSAKFRVREAREHTRTLVHVPLSEIMAFSNLEGVFKLAQRPVHTISNRKEEDTELKADSKGALLFVKDCADCHASLSEKAAKVLLEDCTNLVLDVKSTLISGLLEFVSCKKVVLNLLDGGQVRKKKGQIEFKSLILYFSFFKLESTAEMFEEGQGWGEVGIERGRVRIPLSSSKSMTFSLTLGLAVPFKNCHNFPCFRVFFDLTVQQTQILMSTKMCDIHTIQSLLSILQCPCFIICSN